MATIRTAIQIQDGMSPAFRSMNTAMNIVINSFEALQTASHNTIDTASIQAARTQLAQAEVAVNRVEDEIRQANQESRKMPDNFNRAQGAAEGLISKIKGIGASLGLAFGGAKVLGLSDEMANTAARLDLIKGAGESVAELQEEIFQSAQNSRAAYIDTAAAVSKLGLLAGKAFSNNDEIIGFTELMNKNFVIGGAAIQEQKAAMYQLTQAMAAGKLQGDEYRSITENAPLLATAIEDYMVNVQKVKGSMKEWASEGMLTAEVIKAAMFSSADEVNEKFASMPMTWGQIWTSVKNQSMKVFQPVLMEINEIANTASFANVTKSIISGLSTVAYYVGEIFRISVAVGSFFYENWGMISPIIYGIVGAMAAYHLAVLAINTVSIISQGIQLAAAVATAIHTKATLADTSAKAAATASQWGLNAAILACPITWIIGLIIVLITVFYGVIGAVNEFAGTSTSATGLIAGAFMIALAYIGNLFVSWYNLVINIVVVLWNYIATFAEFFANVFNDPIGSIVRLFAGMADAVLGILEAIASAIDTIFGSDLASAVSGWRGSLQGAVDDLVGEAKIKVDRLDGASMHLDRFNYGDAFNTGYKFGEGIDKKIGSVFDPAKLKIPNQGGYSIPDGTAADVADTAKNTGAMKDAMDISNEDLKYMRDIAEQEVINRFTTAEIKVDMTNNNSITKETDFDGVVSYLENKIYETMEVAAEGVHS